MIFLIIVNSKAKLQKKEGMRKNSEKETEKNERESDVKEGRSSVKD